MTKEYQEFKRKYLLKQPEFTGPLLVQRFTEICRERMVALGLDVSKLASMLAVRPNRIERMLTGDTQAKIYQYVKLAHILGGHIEMKLVIDHDNRPLLGRYHKPGRPELGIPGVPPDISLHPLARASGPEDETHQPDAGNEEEYEFVADD